MTATLRFFSLAMMVPTLKPRGQPRPDLQVADGDALVPLEEDRELLPRYRNGDRDALHVVFQRYLPVVMRALRGGARVGEKGARLAPGVDEMELESMAQETFVRAFAPSARMQYDGLRPFSAYIATIAKNLLVDEARRRARRPHHVALDDVAYQLTDNDALGLPDRHLEATALRDQLTAFRSGLTAEEQRVYQARFEDQSSLREASKATGIGLFALRKIDVRLRLALLKQLRSDGYLEDADVKIGASVVNRSVQSKKEISK